tara:strand:+ start:425 stop:730 length:306 start_codon:yes stop_codon:yes gene_type:complete
MTFDEHGHAHWMEITSYVGRYNSVSIDIVPHFLRKEVTYIPDEARVYGIYPGIGPIITATVGSGGGRFHLGSLELPHVLQLRKLLDAWVQEFHPEMGDSQQ